MGKTEKALGSFLAAFLRSLLGAVFSIFIVGQRIARGLG
jgi:hypothetical protein